MVLIVSSAIWGGAPLCVNRNTRRESPIAAAGPDMPQGRIMTVWLELAIVVVLE